MASTIQEARDEPAPAAGEEPAPSQPVPARRDPAWRDWAGGLPDKVYERVAATLVADSEAAHAAFGLQLKERMPAYSRVITQLRERGEKVGGHFDLWTPPPPALLQDAEERGPSEGGKGGETRKAAHGLLPFALVCRRWRRIQVKQGPLHMALSTVMGYGRGELVQWVVEVGGCPLSKPPEACLGIPGVMDHMADLAAAVGAWEIFEWLCKHKGFEPSVRSFHFACGGLHAAMPNVWATSALPFVRNLHAMGCPMDSLTFGSAAWGGELEVCKFLKAEGLQFDAVTSLSAAGRGNIHVLEWLLDLGCDVNPFACQRAVYYGYFECLKWLRARGAPWDEHALRAAALNGSMDMLQWMVAEGAPWDEQVCTNAVQAGRLDVLQWLRSKGCPWDASGPSTAARENHLEILQWLLQHRCPCDQGTCTQAALAGHLDVLRWAVEQGCPAPDRLCELAAEGGNLDVLRWTMEQGFKWGEQTCVAAAAAGHLDIVQFLWSKECPLSGMTSGAAAAEGQVEVLKWLKAKGCPRPQGYPNETALLVYGDEYGDLNPKVAALY